MVQSGDCHVGYPDLASQSHLRVILAHCGGAKIIDALLLAESYDNIYLDTSFTLPYWMESSVEGDIAFAMNKLGMKRWMFGSDSPFISRESAIDTHKAFLHRYSFSNEDIEQFFFNTARGVFLA